MTILIKEDTTDLLSRKLCVRTGGGRGGQDYPAPTTKVEVRANLVLDAIFNRQIWAEVSVSQSDVVSALEVPAPRNGLTSGMGMTKIMTSVMKSEMVNP